MLKELWEKLFKMHAVFIPYGKKEWVDIFLRDLAAQKLTLRYHKEGEEDKHQFIECQLRVLPLGLYEFVFPKEHMDAVLTTLNFHMIPPYNIDKEISFMTMKIKPLDYAKKFLNIEDAPEFKTDKLIPWNKIFVSIIPIGVRYDGELTDSHGEMAGWIHEAI